MKKERWYQYFLLAQEYDEIEFMLKNYQVLFEIITAENVMEYKREIEAVIGDICDCDDNESVYDYAIEQLEFLIDDTMAELEYSDLTMKLEALSDKLDDIIDTIKLFDKANINYDLSTSDKSVSAYLEFDIKDYDKVYDVLDLEFPALNISGPAFEINKTVEDLQEANATTFTLRLSDHAAGGRRSYFVGGDDIKYTDSDLEVIWGN